MTRYVIIGNGIAGISAAETIRELDSYATITMIAAETFPPYSRPMISMVLEGSAPREALPIRPDSYYRDWGIESLVGRRAEGLDPDRREVLTDRGDKVPYDRLLIATGADPRRINVDGEHLAGILPMRTERHVREMLRILPQVKQALVLGGGLVGFKAAYGLLRRGVKVTMLIRSAHPLIMQVDRTAGDLIRDELVKRGLDVRVNVEAVAFEGRGSVEYAELSDGSRLPCELVVVGKGVRPALSFIPRNRIKVDLGICVDPFMQTSEPDVFAAGDVAEATDVVRGQPWVNAIWPVAVEQGRWAGFNMAGRKAAYPGSMGRNVIRVFDLDVLAGGVVTPPANNGWRVVQRLDSRLKYYRKLVLHEDRPAGLVMVGHIEQGGVLLSMIQRRTPLSVAPEDLLEPRFNFGQIFNASIN